jgi:SAM-dependent MidA family methyltransferase
MVCADFYDTDEMLLKEISILAESWESNSAASSDRQTNIELITKLLPADSKLIAPLTRYDEAFHEVFKRSPNEAKFILLLDLYRILKETLPIATNTQDITDEALDGIIVTMSIDIHADDSVQENLERTRELCPKVLDKNAKILKLIFKGIARDILSYGNTLDVLSLLKGHEFKLYSLFFSSLACDIPQDFAPLDLTNCVPIPLSMIKLMLPILKKTLTDKKEKAVFLKKSPLQSYRDFFSLILNFDTELSEDLIEKYFQFCEEPNAINPMQWLKLDNMRRKLSALDLAHGHLDELSESLPTIRALPSFSEHFREAQYGKYGFYQTTINLDREDSQQDYETNASLSNTHATLMAIKLFQSWQQHDKPSRYHVVETSGGNGDLTYHIHHTIDLMASCSPPAIIDEWQAFKDSLRYYCIDISERLLAKQKYLNKRFDNGQLFFILGDATKDRTYQCIPEIHCLHSNEILDEMRWNTYQLSDEQGVKSTRVVSFITHSVLVKYYEQDPDGFQKIQLLSDYYFQHIKLRYGQDLKQHIFKEHGETDVILLDKISTKEIVIKIEAISTDEMQKILTEIKTLLIATDDLTQQERSRLKTFPSRFFSAPSAPIYHDSSSMLQAFISAYSSKLIDNAIVMHFDYISHRTSSTELRTYQSGTCGRLYDHMSDALVRPMENAFQCDVTKNVDAYEVIAISSEYDLNSTCESQNAFLEALSDTTEFKDVMDVLEKKATLHFENFTLGITVYKSMGNENFRFITQYKKEVAHKLSVEPLSEHEEVNRQRSLSLSIATTY